MSWIVGLDLHGRSHGAVRFARWFLSHVEADAARPLVGLHVVDLALFGPLLGEVSPDDLEQAARSQLHRDLGELGLGDQELKIEVATASSTADTLFDRAKRRGAAGLIIGRKADEHAHALVRLGRVARQVARELTLPVFIVPPDFVTDTHQGPIVVATDLEDDSIAAARFAANIARSLGRAVVVTHTLLGLEQRLRPWFPELPSQAVEQRLVEEASARLQTWCKDIGLADVETRVLVGDPLLETRALLLRMHACCCIAGSRRLGLAQRALRVSFGSRLAASATCPVGLIPPELAE